MNQNVKLMAIAVVAFGGAILWWFRSPLYYDTMAYQQEQARFFLQCNYYALPEDYRLEVEKTFHITDDEVNPGIWFEGYVNAKNAQASP